MALKDRWSFKAAVATYKAARIVIYLNLRFFYLKLLPVDPKDVVHCACYLWYPSFQCKSKNLTATAAAHSACQCTSAKSDMAQYVCRYVLACRSPVKYNRGSTRSPSELLTGLHTLTFPDSHIQQFGLNRERLVSRMQLIFHMHNALHMWDNNVSSLSRCFASKLTKEP